MSEVPSAAPPGFVTRLQTWAAHPFTNDLDLFGTFLTVGLVLILVLFWRAILSDIVEIV